MPPPLKVHPAIEFVHGIFDIQGKTVDNVGYAPEMYASPENIWIKFTDGTTLEIVVRDNHLEARLETPNDRLLSAQ